MNRELIEKVKEFVRNEVHSSKSKYGSDPFIHFVNVVNLSKTLAEKKGGDLEIIEIAAWFHDIGSIVNGRKDHHITGSKIAEEKLEEFGYPDEKIERVKHCILTHRGSQKLEPESIEAKIISEADTMDAFNDLAGLFQCAYSFEHLSRGEAKKSVRDKLIRKWNKLSDEAKNIIKSKHEAAMLLLK